MLKRKQALLKKQQPRRATRVRSNILAEALNALAHKASGGRGGTSADSWQLQKAKAEFSTLVRRAIDGHPQVVSKHGKDVVVVLSYEALLGAIEPRESLLDFFRRSPLVGVDLKLERQPGSLREIEL